MRGIETVTRLTLPGVDHQREAQTILLAEIEDLDGVEAIEGAAAFLAALPADRWAIVTSSPRRLVLRRLDAAGLPVPAGLVTAEDVARGKPAPDCFLLAAERLGQNIEDCLVFEDARAGIDAAEEAGAAVVVVTVTHRFVLETGHPTITGHGGLTAEIFATSTGHLRCLMPPRSVGYVASRCWIERSSAGREAGPELKINMVAPRSQQVSLAPHPNHLVSSGHCQAYSVTLHN